MTCFAWIKAAVPGKYRIQIYDGVDTSFSKIHNGEASWQLFRAAHTVNPRAQFLEVRAIQAAKTGHPEDTVYVDGVLFVEGEYFSLRGIYQRNQGDKQQ